MAHENDTRHALGGGIPDPAVPKHEMAVVAEPLDERIFHLPGPHPYDRYKDSKPDIPYTGRANPAMDETRPIADMTPELGEGDLKAGVAFRVPMGVGEKDER